MDRDKGKFKPGSGGRPVGARNRLHADFLKALQDDFRENGPATIKIVRTERPAEYLKIVASVLPKEFIVSDGAFVEMTDDELEEAIKAVRKLHAPAVESVN